MKKIFVWVFLIFTTSVALSATSKTEIFYEHSGAIKSIRLNKRCEASQSVPRFHTGKEKEVFVISEKKLAVGAPSCKNVVSKTKKTLCDCVCSENEVAVALQDNQGTALLTCMQIL